jgi:hypothetical protein
MGFVSVLNSNTNLLNLSESVNPAIWPGSSKIDGPRQSLFIVGARASADTFRRSLEFEKWGRKVKIEHL